VSRSSLEAAVPPNTEILLDTSVVLAYLNASEAASPAATVVIDDFVRTGRNRATISAVSVAETLVRLFDAGPAALGIVDAFLLHFPNLTVANIDYAIAREARCAGHRHGPGRRHRDRHRERREVGERRPHRHALPPGRARPTLAAGSPMMVVLSLTHYGSLD
jgi:uncharacterized protein with PIN domain